MTDEHASEPKAINPEMLSSMGALVGAGLTDDRAAALVPQAEPHFALLRQLDSIADSSIDPAAEFRLDQSTRPASD